MNFLKALKGEDTDETPVWFMRQAGRYLPQYIELRKNRSIKELCMDPDVVAEISHFPVEILGVDAAIIFSDILLPLETMGLKLEYEESVGPVVSGFKGYDSLIQFSTKEFRYPLQDSIRAFKVKHPNVPLIGFVGGPLTMASYAITGGSDRDLSATKRYAMKEPEGFVKVLDLMSDAIITLAKSQMSAGTSVIQIFDSWAGSLSPLQFNNIYRGFLEEVRSELDFPVIYFSTGSGGMAKDLSLLGYDFLSLDWRVDLSKVRNEIDDAVGLQGNLDPVAVESNESVALNETEEILDGMKGKNNYIFNLGHGVLPGTKPETLRKIVELVHNHDK